MLYVAFSPGACQPGEDLRRGAQRLRGAPHELGAALLLSQLQVLAAADGDFIVIFGDLW